MVDRSKRCPYCGRTNGLYTRLTHEVEIRQYDFDGNLIGRFFEQAYEEEGSDGKTMYCQSCNEDVYNISQYKALFSKKG